MGHNNTKHNMADPKKAYLT